MKSKRVSFYKAVNVEHVEDEEESKEVEEQRQFNKFQLLQLVDGAEVENDTHDGDENDDVDQDKCSKQSNSDEEATDSKQTRRENKNSKVVTSVKSRKSKQRRGKKSSKGQPFDNAGDINPEDQSSQVQRQSNEKLRPNQRGCDQQRFKMLRVDLRNLQPETELKKIFGKSVIREDKTRDRIRHPPGSNIQRSRFVSSGYYETKPIGPFSGPKMELDIFMNEKATWDDSESTKQKALSKNSNPDFNFDRPIYFKIVHDKSYQDAQKAFLEAVHRGHPETIVQNLSLFPLHAESLIQLSHMIRVSEDYKTASEFIERALLVFERGFHPRFNVVSANCRLTYRRPENRTLFIAIFKHINFCHRRGLRRTPFEYSKLLLSLAPDNDPLLASQLIDFFAIRSEEYDYLIEFTSRWSEMSRLPNMNFSLALAYFLKSRCNKKSKTEADKNLALADEQLQKALLIFPNFIIPLLDSCQGEPSSELRQCRYFDYSVYGTKYKLVPETVDVLVNIYVKRNYILWKPKHVLAWLESNVAIMVNKFATGELTDQDQCVEHWTSFNKPVPRNLLRHIVLSDLEMKIPQSAAGVSFLDIDPHPPLDSMLSYSILPESSRPATTRDSSGGMSSLFLRSMLPSFSFGEQSSSQSNDNGTGLANSGISLGDFVIDDTPDANADGGLNELQSTIRDLASSLTGLLSLAPLGRNQGQNRPNQSDNGSDQNQQD